MAHHASARSRPHVVIIGGGFGGLAVGERSSPWAFLRVVPYVHRLGKFIFRSLAIPITHGETSRVRVSR